MRSRTEKIMQLAAAAVPAGPPSSSPPPQKRRSQQLTIGLGAGIPTPFDCDLEPHETVTASLISSSLKAVMHSESAKITLPLPYLDQAIPVIDTSETEKSSFNDVFFGVPPNIDDNMSPCQEPAVGDEQITNERLFSELDEFLAFLPSMSEGDKEAKTQTSLNNLDITEYSEVELNNNLDEDYNQIGGKRENGEKDCSMVPEEDVEHNVGNAFIEEDEEETEGAGRISVEDSHSIEQEESSSTYDEENVEGAGRISVEDNNSVAEEDRNDDNVNDEAGFSGKKKRSKKSNSARWMKNTNKRKRETREENSGVKKLYGKWDYNVVRPAKTCNCKLSLKSDLLKCRIIGEDVRKQIFDYFWKKLGWKEKQTYVRGLIDISLPKNIKNREPNHQLLYKTDFSDEWVPLEKRRRSTTGSIDATIKPLYTNPLKIKTEKYKHLQELKKVIFEDYHAFYDNLKH